MSWITFTWSMTAGICLTIGAVHFLVWTRQRDQSANLVFSISAAAAAGYAVLDMVALHAQTPAEYGELWRWALLLGMLEGPLIAWFIRLYLRAGRLWLLWLICGLRALMVVLNFVPGPNFYFREITGLQQMPLLGELISRPHGVLHPWVILMPLSFLLIILFAIDAAHTAARRSGRRRAWVLGGLTAVGFSLGLVSYALYAREVLPSTFSSQLVLSLILLMGYELSCDVLRAAQLTGDLRDSEERMALAAEAAGFGVWMWSVASNQVWASERWLSLFGFTSGADLSFEKVIQRIHPEDRELVERAVRRAIEDGVDYAGDYRVVLPDGTERWISARGRMFKDGNSKPARMLGASLDITSRKQLEAETLQQRMELAHVARVATMGQLASSLAHELNQPLGAILRNAEAAELILQSDPPDLEEIHAILADICKDDQRAGAVIDRTRAMLARRPLASTVLTVDELVDAVMTLTRPDAASRGFRVQVELGPDLPPLHGDHVQLQQVLLNLILNGMDAMDAIHDLPAEERRLVVRARQTDDKTVEFAVIDSGRGIPADQLARIFDPFFTTKPGGLGMGLSISRTIIEAHGGRLWAESHPGRGAAFRFSLPFAEKGAAS